eukprot:UN08175
MNVYQNISFVNNTCVEKTVHSTLCCSILDRTGPDLWELYEDKFTRNEFEKAYAVAKCIIHKQNC